MGICPLTQLLAHMDLGPCPVCEKERILVQERLAGGPPEVWRDPVRYYYVATCNHCGHSVMADRPEDLKKLWRMEREG